MLRGACRGGAYSLVARLSHLTIDYASLLQRSRGNHVMHGRCPSHHSNAGAENAGFKTDEAEIFCTKHGVRATRVMACCRRRQAGYLRRCLVPCFLTATFNRRSPGRKSVLHIRLCRCSIEDENKSVLYSVATARVMFALFYTGR